MISTFLVIYILKTIVVSGIFFAYYHMILRDKKFHYYNRFYLLSGLTLSLVIPLIQFRWFTVQQPVLYDSAIVYNFIRENNPAKKEYDFSLMDVAVIFFSVVATVLLLALIVNVYRIYRIKRAATIIRMEGFDFMNTELDNAPFTFLNNLFWNSSIPMDEMNGEQIFRHEVTHIRQKHTWDRLYCQLISTVLWMNPFCWLIQKELQTIHEFIADEEAVGNTDIENFAGMLLKTHYGNHFLNPTNPFFYSSIKRRLIMLNISSKTKYSYLRRLMVLPLLFISMAIFSVQVNAGNKSVNKPNEIKISAVDTLSPAQASQLEENMGNALVLIDGKESDMTEAKKINPDDILTMDVRKGVNAYGEKGKNGVILITTKKGQQALTRKALLVIDGKIQKDRNVDQIDPNTIATMNVLKGTTATALYGDEGKDGVIEITTKQK